MRPIKNPNAAAETALIREAEPLASLAWVHGASYPESILDRAWKTLFTNHAHDGIAGTSIDEVLRVTRMN